MIAHAEVEQLRAAKNIISFTTKNPDQAPRVAVKTYSEFVEQSSDRIKDQAAKLWPGTKLSDIRHWSLVGQLPDRVERLDLDFTRIYWAHYPQLSWFVHAGLTGVVNQKKETGGR